MCRICYEIAIRLGQWDLAYINNLPDEAFAVIEPDYKRGLTTNKNARHLPHHDANVRSGRLSKGDLDKQHLTEAIARLENIAPVTKTISREELISRAKSHLGSHAEDIKLVIEKPSNKPTEAMAILAESIPQSLKESGFTLISPGHASVRLDAALISVDASNITQESINARLEESGSKGLSMADIIPKPEDFITADYRALSKVVIPSRFLDFTKGNVLKNSVKLIKNATVYANHYTTVENWLGVVTDSWWDDQSDPPGIDIKLKIDALANPRVARGMLMQPPALSRGSAQVFMEYEKSHPDMPDYDFFNYLGREIDGQIVRFIITLIKGYGEFSIVWFGADWGAKTKGKPAIGEN